MMSFGKPSTVISSSSEALLSIQISHNSFVGTLLGYSTGAGGKNHWHEANGELTCVMGACNIVLQKTDPTVCVFTAPMRHSDGTHAAMLLVECVSVEVELHSRLILRSCDHLCTSWMSCDPSKWSHRPEWVLQGWKQMALLMPHWLTDWL